MGIHGIPAGEMHQSADGSASVEKAASIDQAVSMEKPVSIDKAADSANADEELFISADSWAGVHLAPLEWDGAFLHRLVVQDRERAAAYPKADR